MQRPPSGVAVPKPAGSVPASGSSSAVDLKWGSQAVFRPKKAEAPAPVPENNKEKNILPKESPKDSPASSRDKKEVKFCKNILKRLAIFL